MLYEPSIITALWQVNVAVSLDQRKGMENEK